MSPAAPRAGQRIRRRGQALPLSRVGADGASELLYEGPKKLIDFLLDGAGQVSFIHALNDHYRHLVSRKQDGKWIETLRCKRLQSCQLVSASNDGRC